MDFTVKVGTGILTTVGLSLLVVGVTNGLCEHSRACRAPRFFCEHEQK